MLDRDLDVEDVRRVLRDSRTIEEYDDETRLLLGRSGVRPVHVVARDAEGRDALFVITVYEPDPRRWDASFSARRRT